jgi:hypothetical protein
MTGIIFVTFESLPGAAGSRSRIGATVPDTCGPQERLQQGGAEQLVGLTKAVGRAQSLRDLGLAD